MTKGYLVIEVKTTKYSGDQCESDKDKLLSLKRGLRYQYALFLKFRTTGLRRYQAGVEQAVWVDIGDDGSDSEDTELQETKVALDQQCTGE